MGDEAGALPLLKKLNALVPNQPAILNNMAWASRDSQPEQGLAWIETALLQQPDSIELRDTHSVLLAATGQSDAALALNDTLVREAPDRPSLVVSRARILQQLGRGAEAIQLLESLLARSGDVSGARALLNEIKASP
jgi:predicted Zn-dependent protease